jgi:uncharacterized protein (DUF1697 family)
VKTSPRVALLRGVNVGKAKRIAMADLRALLEGLGFDGVSTLLNSGNAVFRAAGPNDVLADRIQATLERDLGVRSRVTVLGASDLRAILDENPLPDAVAEPSRFLISVLRSSADRAPAEALARQDWAPEVLALGHRAVYLWCPQGIATGRLGLALDRALGERGTARNWATLQKLRALLEAL